MIRIRTPSRVHFGLFSLPSCRDTSWLNQEGQATVPRRNFGGVGLMVEKPGIEVSVELAERFTAEGPLAERALHFVQRYRDSVGLRESFHVGVSYAAPEHAGLGTGTQLGLAIARAVAELTQQPTRDAITLARHIGRGARSAIGVHGFEQGGFLVEGGKRNDNSVSPLLCRFDFPWAVFLIFPPHLQGIHGEREREAFAELESAIIAERTTETMARIVLLGILPALIESDLDSFGEALYDYNRRSGELFQTVQKGIYGHPWITNTVKMIRNLGVKGVGQSSWGPVVFAVVSPLQGMGISDWLIKKKKSSPEQMILTFPCNRGMTLSTLS